jgi:O-methyltransferase involved in polyketide biosynthesis
MNNGKLDLGSVQKTMLLPLWGRAIETKKTKPLLIDETAVRIVKEIDFDFSTIDSINTVARLSCIARSIYFDNEIRKYLETFPKGPIINVGCGMDTTFDRIDNGKVIWYDLDLKDVIELRKKYIPESDRRKYISESILENNWYDQINQIDNILLLFSGVLCYFKEEDVKNLFLEIVKHYKAIDIVFDYCSKKGIEIANKKVIQQGGMDQNSNLRWGIDDIYEIEKWGNKINIVNNMPIYKEFKNNYPFFKRIGMIVSDIIKVVSLAHIKLAR